MTTSVFDHPWLGALFGDPEVAALWSCDAQLQHMLRFERAHTVALQSCGLISDEAAKAAIARIDTFRPDQAGLRDGSRRNGVVVPEFVNQLRQDMAEPKAIHSGATSQDVTDTALALTLAQVSDLLTNRVRALIAKLEALEDEFGQAEIAGRTRMQAALPIKAGVRIATWRRLLEDWQVSFANTAAAMRRLQLGGPVGDRRNLGPNPDGFVALVAQELDLAPVPVWHTTRGVVVEYGQSLSVLTGCVGKIGLDVAMMAQQGVDDLKLEGGGKSSAMPHKSNPVLAELLVTLGHYNAGLTATLHNTLLHEQERSGVMWTLEWMVLPQMTEVAGTALNAARDMLAQVQRIGHRDDGG